MDSSQTPTENAEAKGDKNEMEGDVSMATIEAMVTPEQVLSASVAKKRRTITRKRTSSISKTRSQTPMRASAGQHEHTSSEEETNETRAKIPERPRRVTRTASNKIVTIDNDDTNIEPNANINVENKKEVDGKTIKRKERPLSQTDSEVSVSSESKSDGKVRMSSKELENVKIERRIRPKVSEMDDSKLEGGEKSKRLIKPKNTEQKESKLEEETVQRRIRPKNPNISLEESVINITNPECGIKSNNEVAEESKARNDKPIRRVRPKQPDSEQSANTIIVQPERRIRPKPIEKDEINAEIDEMKANKENLEETKSVNNTNEPNAVQIKSKKSDGLNIEIAADIVDVMINDDGKCLENITSEEIKADPVITKVRNKKSSPPNDNEEFKQKSAYIADSSQNSDRLSLVSEPSIHDRASSIPRQLEEQILKLDNFVNVNKKEIMNLFQKAKTTVEEKGKELRRRKFHKTDQKRSQSTPKQLNDDDLLESFRRAQEATAAREKDRIRSESARRYSSGSEKSPSPEPKRPSRKPAKPTVHEIIREKKAKQLKNKVKSNKIIEILDPKTSKVIATKDVGEVSRMGVLDVFKILKYYSITQIFKEYKKYKKDMNDEYAIIRIQRRRCINHLVLLFIFCGLGGVIFKFTEGHFENFYKCGVKRVKRDFIDLLWIKSHNLREEEWKSLARNRLRIFEEELHTAHEAGVHQYSGQRSWSFINGIYYCITVVTTIGYGHLYPTTTTGQALTIVYSLIGIPLFLIILTDFGKLFTRCIKFLWSFVRRLYYTGSCRSVRKTAHVQEIFKGAQMMYDIATFRRPSTMDPNASPPDSNEGNTTAPPTPAISNFEIDDEFNLPISVAILLLVLYIFTGAILFQIWEGWDFFASFYFVFISMSTIGFGDYVPRHPIFKIISIVYLVFGLALMSMCINVVQVKLSDTFSQASAKIGATIGLGVSGDGAIKTLAPKSVEMPQVHGSTIDIQIDRSSPTTSTKL